MKPQQRRFLYRANYHPYLFTLIALTSAAELGLTAFLINVGNELHIWASPNYHSLLILLCFEASWTLLFATAYMMWFVDGGAQILANVASSVFWLLLTSVLWGAAAGLMHNTRSGGNCPGRPSISRFVSDRVAARLSLELSYITASNGAKDLNSSCEDAAN
ncbi:hypothetical protein C8Q75DRAFT_841008 [Abortiporus biennis]|nr:hypothetical protein C8Q75DRAFT_841008 [Abortiporus biennis]